MESKPELRIPYADREPIETARLSIRCYRADDFDAFYSWRSRDDVTRYQDFDTQTREEAEHSFSRASDRVRITVEGDGIVVALERREDSRVIGDMVLFYDSALHDGAEIGDAAS
ncbi:MAG: GNAT family N-acetyltransferase [Thermomicrobiales bacterium]